MIGQVLEFVLALQLRSLSLAPNLCFNANHIACVAVPNHHSRACYEASMLPVSRSPKAQNLPLNHFILSTYSCLLKASQTQTQHYRYQGSRKHNLK